jgi:hypothetical protein
MFVRTELDRYRLVNAAMPFEFNVFDDARRVAVAPSGIDKELSADAGIRKGNHTLQPGFFAQFASRSVGMRFASGETARDRLPEIEGAGTTQKQDLAGRCVNDDED